MKVAILFVAVALVHFVLSVLGVLYTLPVAFDVRGGLEPQPLGPGSATPRLRS
ncbi:MAG TPA: hypothetical protein VFK84_08300 [Burkholderiales bacterium]|nr:hypothetical protein [Burkholderiales bacterium]